MAASTEELACVYSALILQDADTPVTAEKMATILKAANTTVEPFWPGLFAKAIESIDLKGLITNVGAGAGAPAAAGAADAGAAAAAPEEKKEEKKEEEEEEDDDLGFGLFD